MLKNRQLYNDAMSQIAVGNQIWNYKEIGKGNKTPMLILHGWGRSGNEWVQMAGELSSYSGRKAYVLDLPGFGGSSLPNVKNIFEYSELVLQFCSYLEIPKVIIMGHSLGGRVGIVLGSRYPTLVEKLILIDPAGVKPSSMMRVVMRVVSQLFRWVPERVRRKVSVKVMDDDYVRSPTLRELYRGVVKDDLRSDLPHIKYKTWVIWGEKDRVLPLSLLNVYKKLLPSPTCRVIWGAGHDPHFSHYLVLKRVIEEAI
jgi:pimeloyl-ACP methyl ester carboxylesterase